VFSLAFQLLGSQLLIFPLRSGLLENEAEAGEFSDEVGKVVVS